MNQDWSKREVELIVPDYFTMLMQELRHQAYNKTVHRKALRPLLEDRSDASVEKKHQNISAVLAEMGLPYVRGYKPLSNSQHLLDEAVAGFILAHRGQLEPLFESFAEGAPAAVKIPAGDLGACLVDPPRPTKKKKKDRKFIPVVVTNYVEREQHNSVVGGIGEAFVVEYEKWRLIQAGRPDLVKYIDRVSTTLGDGAGYDILSKNEDGSNRYIEVKTTTLPKEPPFYVTPNEVEFARREAGHFYLYRVFNVNARIGLFIQQGKYEDFCRLEATEYKGIF